MAFNTEIITSQECVDIALQNNINFDKAILDKYIINAQRTYLKSTIGEDYYDEILDMVETTSTMTSDNQTVIDNFIKPMLAFFVVWEAMPESRNNITNQGIMINRTEFTNQSDKFDFSTLRNAVFRQGEIYMRDLVEYIKNQQEMNSSKYPLFDSSGKKQQNKNGIIFY